MGRVTEKRFTILEMLVSLHSCLLWKWTDVLCCVVDMYSMKDWQHTAQSMCGAVRRLNSASRERDRETETETERGTKRERGRGRDRERERERETSCCWRTGTFCSDAKGQTEQVATHLQNNTHWGERLGFIIIIIIMTVWRLLILEQKHDFIS